jgi:hypothetical protein
MRANPYRQTVVTYLLTDSVHTAAGFSALLEVTKNGSVEPFQSRLGELVAAGCAW